MVLGEIKAGEYLAGIIGGICTLLLGNTEIIRMYKKLDISLNLDNREKTDSNINALCAVFCRLTAYAVTYALRNRTRHTNPLIAGSNFS